MARTLERKARSWVTVAGSVALGDAVEFMMRPATATEYELAVELASAAARQIAVGDDVRASYGLDELPPEIFGGEDDRAVIGVSTVLVATELALIVASDVRGFADDNGDPYPFDRRHIAMMMQEWVGPASVASQFQEKALASVYRMSAEGKRSAAAPNGNGAAAGNSAGDAATPAPPAPEENPPQTESSVP